LAGYWVEVRALETALLMVARRAALMEIWWVELTVERKDNA
jgi:hypothetical protein